MDAYSRPDRPSSTLSGYEPVASGPTHREAVNGSFSELQNEAGIVHGTAAEANDGADTSGALSVNRPNGEGGNPQWQAIALPLNEMTWPNADAWPQTDSSPEKSRPISGHREQERESAFNLDPVENSSDEGWEGSERESQHAGEVLKTRLSGAALPQPETKVHFVVEEEKYDPASTNRREPSDALSESAGNAVISPIAMGAPDKKDGYVNEAELSGKVSVQAEFSQRTDSPKTVDNRQYPAPMPTERYRPEPVEKTAHQAGRPLHKSTAASQVQSEAVTKGSFAQGKAVAGNIAERKATAALHNTVDDILTNDMDLGPLSQSSVAEAGQEKVLTKVAAQAQPTSVQASVLHSNPISHNNVRHTAKAAYGASVDASKVPEVKIGQVDVFIEAPQSSDKRGTSSSRPSLSLSSRHYLRRL
jgi:hypothetical protein